MNPTSSPKKNLLNSFKNIKKNNILVFLFFFIISSCLWFLMELSKTHTSQMEIPLKLENIPNNAKISDKSSAKLIVSIQGDGYSLLQEQIDNINLPITIDFGLNKKNKVLFSKSKEVDSEYYILTRDFHSNITLRLNKNIKILEIKPDTIYFYAQENLAYKRVKIINKANYNISPEYIISKDITFTPDSIDISGPKAIIDSIDYICTSDADLGEISKNISQKVDLKSINEVSFSEKTVLINFHTEKYTEKTISVPIIPVNFEEDYTVQLIPNMAKISFKVPLSLYSSVNETDFIVNADYNKKINGAIVIDIKSKIPRLSITKKEPLMVKYILNKNVVSTEEEVEEVNL